MGRKPLEQMSPIVIEEVVGLMDIMMQRCPTQRRHQED
jgi:hypothetical protein